MNGSGGRPESDTLTTMFNSIGPLEIGLVLLIVLVIFGPKRLPGLGKQLGSGMREFKDSITGDKKDDDDTPEHRGALDAAPVATTTVEPAARADADAQSVSAPSTGETERSTGLADERRD